MAKSEHYAELLGISSQLPEWRAEEFWQVTFTERQEVLIPVLGGKRFLLRPKSYVGGKALDNTGGNVVDFLAQQDHDSVLIELKTPAAPLLGGKYRNAYLPSRELVGSCVQILEYRTSLIENAAQFHMQDLTFRTYSPIAYVIIGDLGREELTGPQRRSFEVFRTSFREVRVLTYDEFFLYLEQLAEIIEGPGPVNL